MSLTLDDLQYKGLMIYQDSDGFRFGTDAVLLASFAGVRRGDRIADLGTGTGILPLLISARVQDTVFVAFELQQRAADIAAESVKYNRLDKRIQVECCDFRTRGYSVEAGTFDAVVSNPPYYRTGAVSETESKAAARHEIACTIDETVASAFRLLKSGGRFSVVYSALRTADLLCSMRQGGIEPKRLRLVLGRADRPPKLILAEGIKHGRAGTSWEAPLVLTGSDGLPTDEVQRIYHRGEYSE